MRQAGVQPHSSRRREAPRAPDRVLLLLPTTSYKARAFLDAAERLGLDVVVGTDRPKTLAPEVPQSTLTVDLSRPEASLLVIEAAAAAAPFAAVVGVDDETTVLAALAAETLGLPHNPLDAVRATRDKHLLRRRLAEAGRPGPSFEWLPPGTDPQGAARRARYPCVLKPLGLSAGRGVIRADNPADFVQAYRRIERILADPEVNRLKGTVEGLLVEDYLAGDEFALEALQVGGELRPLALFDKPDPLEGPTFPETLLVTPSRRPPALQRAIIEEAGLACEALGLREGPIHAELRLDRGVPWLVELGARTIGGLCSRALRFGDAGSLEELVLRHATGRATPRAPSADRAAGIMMLPVTSAGILVDVKGIDDARRVACIDDVTISVHRGAELSPLPEGHRYLGFLFASADSPDRVEGALREACRRLEIVVQKPPAMG